MCVTQEDVLDFLYWLFVNNVLALQRVDEKAICEVWRDALNLFAKDLNVYPMLSVPMVFQLEHLLDPTDTSGVGRMEIPDTPRVPGQTTRA